MPFVSDRIQSMKNNEFSESKEAPVISIDVKHSTNSQFKSRFTFDVNNIQQTLQKEIIGQTDIIDQVVNMLHVVRADITEKNKPLYVALFLGPTGVGKTETVRVLADAIYKDKDAFSRIDMNTLAQEHYAAAITGAPPGYIGSKEGSTLFDEEKINGSFSKPGMVLFDEIEKADKTVIQSLLNVLDNGKMILSNGERTINFRNTMIFMTSNIAASQIIRWTDNSWTAKCRRFLQLLLPKNFGKSNKDILKRIIYTELEKEFAPEFINRIDDILIFNWLENETFDSILNKMIADLNKRIKNHNCKIILDDQAKRYILNKGFNRQYGARAMKRQLRQLLEVPLAKYLTELTYTDKEFDILISTTNNKLTFSKND
ncbi:AAA family ATPase [Rummeliibacillus sp. JY-2-4R]